VKRIVIPLVVVGLLMAFPGVAFAAKGGHPGKPITAGKTCAELVANGAVWNPGAFDDGSYTATLPACIDIGDVPAGNWTVSWTITEGDRGSVEGLLFMIKDSMPGDTCWSEEILSPALSGGTTAIDIPASGADACGTGFAEAQEPEPLAFVAMYDMKRAKGDWVITVEVTPPSN
jgi:hypothetical protein